MKGGITAREWQVDRRRQEQEECWAREHCPEIVGTHPSLMAALQIARLAAEDGECTVLITGETGSGKELVAAAIHECSTRRVAPYRTVNAASLPTELADSLLFGHEKGAFTDAATSTLGVLREAHGGSVFLDEIQELHPRVQAKLLRFLQDHRVTPVGAAGEPWEVDVRIIAGSNQHLHEVVAAGGFRADLYYRLNVLPIDMPPLHKRIMDIPLLAAHFITQFNERKRCITSLSPTALGALMAYDWPGNVRELRNLMERLVIVCRDRSIEVSDLPPELTGGHQEQHTQDTNLKFNEARAAVVATFEHDYICRQWVANDYHLTRTSEAIGKSRQWLSQQLRKYDLETPSRGRRYPTAQ